MVEQRFLLEVKSDACEREERAKVEFSRARGGRLVSPAILSLDNLAPFFKIVEKRRERLCTRKSQNEKAAPVARIKKTLDEAGVDSSKVLNKSELYCLHDRLADLQVWQHASFSVRDTRD